MRNRAAVAISDRTLRFFSLWPSPCSTSGPDPGSDFLEMACGNGGAGGTFGSVMNHYKLIILGSELAPGPSGFVFCKNDAEAKASALQALALNPSHQRA